MFRARALYDNVAETPEELAFRRGEILTVLEQNHSGLDGWWLCALKGRRGIAPGNRLVLLESLNPDQQQQQQQQQQHRIGQPHLLQQQQQQQHDLTSSTNSNTPKTWHQQPKVVTPKRHGDAFLYDVPQRARTSDARNSDYDVPPSRSPRVVAVHAASPSPTPSGRGLQLPLESDYDHPKSSRTVPSVTPSPCLLHPDHYDVPNSNRSSTVSMLSTGSSLSALSSSSCQPDSLCVSERSSLDLSGHDGPNALAMTTYDVPPSSQPVCDRLPRPEDPTYDTPKPHPKHILYSEPKSLDICDNYDVLKPSRVMQIEGTPIKDSHLIHISPRDSPKTVSDQTSLRAGLGRSESPFQLYDNAGFVAPPPGAGNITAMHAYDSPRSLLVKKLEDTEYDTPRPSRTASPSQSSQLRGASGDSFSVYDVPPTVTKDVSASQDNNKGGEEKRESADSGIESFPFEALALDLRTAMNTLVKLQDCVNKSCGKLMAFVRPNWRSPENLEPRVYEVKVASQKVGEAGDLFLEFAQGALVNASRSEDRKLTKKLLGAVETMRTALEKFHECLQRLNKDMWPLVALVRPVNTVPLCTDDLDAVIQVTKDIPEYTRSISGLIQGNSMQLFKKSGAETNGEVKATKAKSPPPTKPKPRVSPESGAPVARFTAKSSPENTVVKTGASPGVSLDTIDSSDSNSSELPSGSRGHTDSDYDVPKPLAKDDSQNVLEEKIPAPPSDIVQETYDYVSLTKNPNVTPNIPADQSEVVIDLSAVKMRDHQTDSGVYDNGDESVKKPVTGRSRVVQSLFPPSSPVAKHSPKTSPETAKISPETVGERAGGLSASFRERLQRLQRDSEEVKSYGGDDYDVPQSQAARHHKQQSRSSHNVNLAALHSNDRTILQFYRAQVETHANVLVNAIEVFLKCVEEQQAPKSFIAYSKFVILAAHKIVYIGDTLTRHLINDNIRNDIMNHAYTLCELLKDTVSATKKAALDYPALTSMQDMVDRVSEVSVAANQLKQIIVCFGS